MKLLLNILFFDNYKFYDASTPKESYRTRQSKKNSSRCSIVRINWKIDPLSEYEEVDEEVIYSQGSYGCGRDGNVMHVIVEDRVHVLIKKNNNFGLRTLL